MRHFISFKVARICFGGEKKDLISKTSTAYIAFDDVSVRVIEPLVEEPLRCLYYLAIDHAMIERT
jgi:hypothetical protein